MPEPANLYASVQAAIRKQAGQALRPVLKQWRYRNSSEKSALPLKGDSMRFLVRYGVLDAGNDATALDADYRALLQRLSRASGDAPGVVAEWLELFAKGEYGVLPSAICGLEPRCAECPLKESCRYLAAGGKDEHLFGKSLSRELLADHTAPEGGRRTADLLAFALCGENCGAANIARAEAFLKECHGLRGLFQASSERLRELGLSDPAGARLKAIADLCREWAEERTPRGQVFGSGKDFYDFFYTKLRERKQEVFLVVLLDQKHALISYSQVSEGTLTEALVHPREVFAPAIEQRAAAVAVVHNHPSGDPTPSSADRAITRRLGTVAGYIGIRLLDHVIIGEGTFVSFVEKGLMGAGREGAAVP